MKAPRQQPAGHAAPRDDGAVQPRGGGDVRRVQERLRLPEDAPVAGPDADRLRALPAGDGGGQFRRPQAVVRRPTAGWRMAGMRMMIDDYLRLRAFGLQVLGWDLCAVATRSTGPKTCTSPDFSSDRLPEGGRSEEHTSELQSPMYLV